MDAIALEQYEEVKAQKELAENSKWKKRREKVLEKTWVLWVFVVIGVFVLGIQLGLKYNPMPRDLWLVQGACGYENVSARIVQESVVDKYHFVCERTQ